MKKNIRFIMVCIPLILFPIIFYAQTVGFKYDEAGNRISRDLIILNNSVLANSDSSYYSLKPKEYYDEFSNTQIIISPNPNGGIFEVALNNLSNSMTEERQIHLFIHDINGNLIFEIEKLLQVNQIDIDQHQSGTYILTLIADQEKRSWKVIKK